MKNRDKPAFPIPAMCGDWGLTKREHFAGLAMQGVLSDFQIMEAIRCEDDKDTASFVAGLSVEYANALLEALEDK